MTSQPFDISGVTPAIAADPSTPIDVIAQIVNLRPDLRAVVASNPAAPQDLLTWLSSLNDPAINAAIAARHAAPGGLAGGEAQPPVASPSTQQLPVETPGFETPAQLQREYPSASAPASEVNAGGLADATPPNSHAADDPYGAYPGYGAPTKKKSKAGMWVGLGAAAALVIGGGAFAANKLWFSKVGGAASPDAAVTQMIDGLAKNDFVSVYGVTSPAEVAYLGRSLEVMTAYFKDIDGFKDVAKDLDPKDYAKIYTLKADGIKVAAAQLGDPETSRVTLESGSFTLNVDGDKIITLVKKYSETASEIGGSLAGSAAIDPDDLKFGPEEEAELRKEIADSFPLEISVGDGVATAKTPSGDVDAYSTPLSVVTVKEGKSWYVTPTLTAADYAMTAAGITERGSLADVEDVKGAASATAAGEALFASVKTSLSAGNLDAVSNSFPLVERRVLAFAKPAMKLDEVSEELKKAGEMIDFKDIEFAQRRADGDLAWLELKKLGVAVKSEGQNFEASVADGCVKVPNAFELCMNDPKVPGLKALGLDQLSFVAVKEKSGWFVSPSLSYADVVGVVGAKLATLAKDGKLNEAWFKENFGEIGSLFGLGGGLPSLTPSVPELPGLDAPDTDAPDTDGAETPQVPPAPGTAADVPAALQAELKSASKAVSTYLKANPDTVWPSLEDTAFKASDKNSLAVMDFKSGSSFCIGGYNMESFEAGSINEAGEIFSGLLCSAS